MSGENEVERALTLISHHLCPYVQRAAIALAEKGIAFERINIDLAAKPDWFKAVSPLGKVPVLRVTHAGGEETSIFKSAVILEYLEETSPSPLHPGDALQRARHRGWIEFGSQVLNGIGRFYSATERATFERERAALEAMFARLEEELAEGPFFAGANFSLVDAVFAPVFRYFDGFEALGVLGILAGKPRVTGMAQGACRKAVGQSRRRGGFPGKAAEVLRGAQGCAGAGQAGRLTAAPAAALFLKRPFLLLPRLCPRLPERGRVGLRSSLKIEGAQARHHLVEAERPGYRRLGAGEAA